MLPVLILAACLAAQPVPDKPTPSQPPAARVSPKAGEAKAEHQDVRLRFLGWSANSDEYAWLRVTERSTDGEVQAAEQTFYVRKLVAKGGTEAVTVTGSVLAHLKDRGYSKKAVPVARVSDMETRLEIGERTYLKFELVIGQGLGYRLSLFKGDSSEVLEEKQLEEAYTTVEPTLYVAPDGRRFVLLLHCATPYRTRDRIQYLPLSL
jgi:hypothetical protein